MTKRLPDAARSGKCIGQFSIGLRESRFFAALSGDHNPVHVDEAFARRTVFHETVAHGVHVLLRTLDCLTAGIGGLVQINHLRATFSSPARMGSLLSIVLKEDGQGRTKMLVRSGDETIQDVVVEWAPTQALVRLPGGCLPPANAPADLDFAAAAAAAGKLPLAFDSGRAEELFPSLCGSTSGLALGTLLASTRIVGMECPGLHSIYSAVSLSWDSEANARPGQLDYSVVQAVERLALMKIRLSGPAVTGSVTAFRRPPPVRQPAFRDAQAKVPPQAFGDTEAIVIGGSRGLGEVTAKLLAAGGAKVAITYNRGREEAEAVAAEIRAGGGSCVALDFDIQAPVPLGATATHLGGLRHIYYFATPFIAGGPRHSWDHALFNRFCDYFIQGMVTSVLAIAEGHGLDLCKLRVCQPSTRFLDGSSADFAEYVAAKAAAEVAGRALAARHPGMMFLCPRLPRILTDQTSAMIPVDTEDAAQQVLHMLHGMHPSSQEGAAA